MPTLTYDLSDRVATVDISDESLPETLVRMSRAREVVSTYRPPSLANESGGTWCHRGGVLGTSNVHTFAWLPGYPLTAPTPEPAVPSTDRPITIVVVP